ncbi:hypothetical protein [Vibrio agarivorans]|uniref:SPOR domain-containing protein n=1 Tax=Vibrio agarivorans TaxID=153622 RepID=A0ABT7Y7L9_9VIBR|nr:hypothetical protein [Vibrio agarivorans]MDN2483965.1 hypothetical protein [Vibrio agarivorans]
MNSKQHIISACTVIALTGCANQGTSAPQQMNGLTMNQPVVSDVVPLTEGYVSPESPMEIGENDLMAKTSTNYEKSTGGAIPYINEDVAFPDESAVAPNLEDEIWIEDASALAQQPFTEVSVAMPAQEPQEIFTSYGESDVNDYILIRGEKYEATLMRWLHAEGYTKVGKLLDDEYQWKMEQVVERDEMLTTTFDEALRVIKDRISANVEPESTDLYDTGPDPLPVVDPIATSRLSFNLDRELNEAIISSSILPTTMFVVERGDLMTNYLRLAAHYNWEAEPDFFLSPNYETPFNYIIVTEKQNVRSAFQHLLKPYPNLKAGLYRPSRQVFIEEDK